MERTADALDDVALVDSLRAYGVRYLTDVPGALGPVRAPLPLSDLLVGLARSEDPRVRHSIAPLLLVRPDVGPDVPAIAGEIESPAKEELVDGYVAAVYLQHAWRTRLRRYLGELPVLEPLWIGELGLPAPDELFGRAGLVALQARRGRRGRARHTEYEQAALNLFGQLVTERASQSAAAVA